MVLLKVDLQDGFKEDTVTISVNDRAVFHKDNVSTKLLLGYADSLKLDVPTGSIIVAIAVQSRGLSETLSLDISERLYVGVSIQDNHVTCQVSTKPFVYF
ncbi:MAG: hypothetical protein ACXV3D_00405 [Halobacteriota archaeon]